MRILDAILAGNAPSIDLANFKRRVQDMETFDIDNVAEYLYVQMNPDHWNLNRDFPNLAPPYPSFWMEHRRPSKIVTHKTGELPSATLPYRTSFWFTAEDPAKSRSTTAQRVLARQAKQENIRWTMTCQTFLQGERHMPVIGPISEQALLLDNQGAVIDGAGGIHSEIFRGPMPDRDRDNLLAMWFPALLAISFLHCRNVTVQREQPPDPKLAKRQLERGEKPRVIFKTLNITPMKAVLEKAMTETPGGLKRALHICRGHFANYEERGLFGKYQGRFWISQHLRGDLNKGIVHKTYDVKAPAK